MFGRLGDFLLGLVSFYHNGHIINKNSTSDYRVKHFSMANPQIFSSRRSIHSLSKCFFSKVSNDMKKELDGLSWVLLHCRTMVVASFS